MRLLIRVILALVFAAALLSFAATYTVRYTEAAVLTTFGKAGEGDVHREAGLYFKWPYPVQSVTKYDSRVRSMTVKLETQQTADAKQVVVESFCNWRVQDPLKFFRKFSNAGDRSEEHFRKAESALESAMRSAVGLISKYSMDDLFTAGPNSGKLPELEGRMRDALRASADNSGLLLQDLGIEVVDVGVMRIVLPEETTKAVFERMKASREKIGKETESRGKAEAQVIRAKAENHARLIQQFAESLAKDIQARGDAEAQPYLAQMQSNPDLAVFLLTMDFIRDGGFGKQATLVLSGDMPGVPMLEPGAIQALRDGQVPTVAKSNWMTDVLERRGTPVNAAPVATPASTPAAAPKTPAAPGGQK